MFDFEKIRDSGRTKLKKLAKDLSELQPTVENPFCINFASNLLSPEYTEKRRLEISEWAKRESGLYVYYFSMQDESCFESALNAINKAKSKKPRDRAYPRINYTLNSKKSSRYLYVGSSKAIAHRFKEHLGYGHKKTYAMNLAYWCDGLEIEFFCLKFESNTNQAVLQAFEDAMWGQLKPMLGRRGAR